jgi:hypothetical protein
MLLLIQQCSQVSECFHVKVHRFFGNFMVMDIVVVVELTVFVQDLLSQPHAEWSKILSFVANKDSKEYVYAFVASNEWQLMSAQLQSSIGMELPVELQAIFSDVMNDEMQSSDGLSKWPCNSFLDLEVKHGILAHSRYYDMAANCSDPFVKCSVAFDKREQRLRET